MKNVLVTGGAGYIGSHVCKALSVAGHKPIAFDNLSTGHQSFVKWGPLIVGDLLDRDCLHAALVNHQIDAVCHFAAVASVAESMSRPDIYYRNNSVGTLNLLDALREAECKTLVFSSTCAVYGEPGDAPISEVAPTLPVNPYGRSKLMCESMINDFAQSFAFKAILFRYFNVSGADAAGELGEWRKYEPHLIPRAMMSLLGHIHDFQIHGDGYATPDGTAIRDFIHVVDLADAHVGALTRLLGGGCGGTFNLGAGRGFSVLDIVREIEEVAGCRLADVRGSLRPGDPRCLIADTTLARTALGFSPNRSSISQIIESSWKWHSIAHAKL